MSDVTARGGNTPGPTPSDDERQLRAALANIEIEIDARERYPLQRDLGWSRLQLASLKMYAARLRQRIAVVKVLAGLGEG